MTGATFLTGGTGYLGSYVVARLLEQPDERLALLVRASERSDAVEKFWRAMQLHWRSGGRAALETALRRVEFVLGDLTAPRFGLGESEYRALAQRTSSVVHIAASLNRRSERACLNTNQRGTLSVVRFAQQLSALRRFTHVSTVAVAGERGSETLSEVEALDWSRRDYDPYARTKKFCEHLVQELLGEASYTIVRPSIVLGDSRFPETTQFDMVRAFCALADLPIVPLSRAARLDIVNVDFVAEAIVRLHRAQKPRHTLYHLSAGIDSPTAGAVADAVARSVGRRPARFAPSLQTPFTKAVRAGTLLPSGSNLGRLAALLDVFLPYLTFDTIFRNDRVVGELGIKPAAFTEYCGPLYTFAKRVGFRYPYLPLPSAETANRVVRPEALQ